MRHSAAVRVLWLISITAAVNAPSSSRALADEPWPRHVIDDVSIGADGVRMADANGDGLLDITTGWEEGGLVRVYLNPGPAEAKSAWPAVTVGSVKKVEDAVLVDLDGDGALDVVSASEDRQRPAVWVHWAPSEASDYLDAAKWTTAPFPAVEGRAAWMFSEPMEIDGRLGIDLAVGGKSQRAVIGWLRSPANPRDLAAWTYHPLRKAGWIMSLVAHDMDGDGDNDILATDRKGAASGCLWLENPGHGAAAESAWAEHKIAGQGREVMFADLVDFTGDGLLDVALVESDGPIHLVTRSALRPAAWSERLIEQPAPVGGNKAVRVVDINQDGRLDLIVTGEPKSQGSNVVWMSYRDTFDDAAWDVHAISGPVGEKYDLIGLVDLDADGDLDVASSEERTRLGVVWYENPTRP